MEATIQMVKNDFQSLYGSDPMNPSPSSDKNLYEPDLNNEAEYSQKP